MAIDWDEEQDFVKLTQMGNLLLSHFGYAAIAATGALFKLAVAATLASYSAFLVATFVGSLATYFPSRFLGYALESAKFSQNNSERVPVAFHLLASPVVGAMIVNATLGWGLALAPMLALGGVSLVLGLAFMCAMLYHEHHLRSQAFNQLSAHVRNNMFSTNTSKGRIPTESSVLNSQDNCHNSFWVN